MDGSAHGLGGSSSSSSWELKLLWWCWAANTTLSGCITDPCTAWTRGIGVRSAATKHNKVWTWFIKEKGAAPPCPSLRHRSLYCCYWEKQLQSEYYFCRADRNAKSEIFLTQVFLTVLYIINIFIITHVQKILHCCKTSPEQIQESNTELQWREWINLGFLEVVRLCVFSCGNPHKAMAKICMLCLKN